MADQIESSVLPPPSEEVHLPDPAYTPVILAFGISIVVVGVVLHWAMVAVGGIIALVALIRWIRQSREEMAQLPLSH